MPTAPVRPTERARVKPALTAAAAALALAGCSSIPSVSLFDREERAADVAVIDPSPSGPQTFIPPAPSPVEVADLGDAPTPAPAAPAAPAGVRHRVVAGDTVYSLARRYGVTPADIQRANGLDGNFAIQLDQELTIPTSGAPVAAAPASPAGGVPGSGSPGSGQPIASAPVRPLVRPTDGPIVSNFRDRMGSALNDGVDIGAPAGAPVVAAADGSVAFVSDQTSPIGSVVLLQHEGGMTTIYGRLGDVLVEPGQAVSAGQRIASVVQPRSGGRPALHFELRRGSEPIDPTPFL